MAYSQIKNLYFLLPILIIKLLDLQMVVNILNSKQIGAGSKKVRENKGLLPIESFTLKSVTFCLADSQFFCNRF